MCMHECSESCDEISSYPFPIGNRWAAFVARETKAGAGLGSVQGSRATDCPYFVSLFCDMDAQRPVDQEI